MLNQRLRLPRLRRRARSRGAGQAPGSPSGLRLDIPGRGAVHLEHLVLDFNGTLGLDGFLLAGIRSRLHRLANLLHLHIVTADLHGSVRSRCVNLPCQVYVLPPGPLDLAKQVYVQGLGERGCVCIGNGANDAGMLRVASIGIAVLGAEGAATSAVHAADLVAPTITYALDLLLHPGRLVATLLL